MPSTCGHLAVHGFEPHVQPVTGQSGQPRPSLVPGEFGADPLIVLEFEGSAGSGLLVDDAMVHGRVLVLALES
ncbi:hypothetical protein ACFU9X_10725 [Streptomyces atratus]|uniref:hypothetical protein n=1 Tax=Streptomyces atratus TaxID=1893 RepID=UPI0036BCF2F6